MEMPKQKLTPLSSTSLSKEEEIIVSWLRSTKWEAAPERNMMFFRTKVPEFFKGVRMYRMQAQADGKSATSMEKLEIFIRKLGLLGILQKKQAYPLSGHGGQARYLTLSEDDLANIGVGSEEDEE